MKDVQVVAPMGAVVRGPATVRLSKEQHASRAADLGKPRRDGIYKIPGDVALTFKMGESFGMDQPTGRLNSQLFAFEVDDPETGASGEGEGPGQGTNP